MNKTSAEIEREVEASRGDLDRTVEALKDKMTPGQLFDELTRSMGGAGNQLFGKLVDQAKENPMPLALTGIGLAWLMMGKGSGGGSSAPTAYGGYSAPSSARGVDGSGDDSIGDKVSGAFGAAADRLSDASSTARDSASQLAQQASGAVHAVGDRVADLASNAGQTAQQSFMNVLEREPLIVGAIGLALGVALGAALPSTQVEDEHVGALRDQLFDKARETARRQVEDATAMAGSAYTSVKEEISKQTGEEGEGPLSEKVGRIVEAGVGAIEEKLGGNSAAGSSGDGSQAPSPAG